MIRKTAVFVACSVMALLILYLEAFGASWLLLGWDGFFERAFEKTSAEEATGIGPGELTDVHRATAGYVLGENDSPQRVCMRFDGPIEFYKEDELRHLEDVRNVFASLKDAFFGILAAAAAVFLVTVLASGEACFPAVKLTALLSGIYAVFASLLFDPLFTAFHRLMFPGGNWIFYPDISLMVNLYSGGVFLRCGAFIALFSLVIDALVWGAAEISEKRGRRK